MTTPVNFKTPRTLYEKLWDSHVVREREDGTTLLYIDRHLLHEVSTPQSFLALEERKLSPRRRSSNLATPDHAVPTQHRNRAIADPQARAQTARLTENVTRHEIPFIALDDIRQGIVHVVGPEQGFTLPGLTLVCGDSHTSTHGAFGALAFGIGASECGIVMATQALVQRKARTMEVKLWGELQPGVCAKDIALALIRMLGANGAAGHAIEYTGNVVRRWSMEARMTLCNMAIEAGARVALISPDQTTFDWIEGRPMAPAIAGCRRCLTGRHCRAIRAHAMTALSNWMSARSPPTSVGGPLPRKPSPSMRECPIQQLSAIPRKALA
jgi:3-isopropylmalate/(R)-2-methylmalate dehydratase large subunit